MRDLTGERGQDVAADSTSIQHRKGLLRAIVVNVEGYRFGAHKAEDLLTWCADFRIPMVSLWWLSTENLARAPADVAAVLMVIEREDRRVAPPGSDRTPADPNSPMGAARRSSMRWPVPVRPLQPR